MPKVGVFISLLLWLCFIEPGVHISRQ